MTKFLWFTGLSGSGKTTLAEGLEKLLKNKGKKVQIIDGDVVRSKVNKHLGFTPEDIKENNRYVIGLCQQVPEVTDYVIVSLISPFRTSREEARDVLGDGFVEIYLDCPYDECKKRDTKGLYAKAEKGEIKNFIGLHIPYEHPLNPEVRINCLKESKGESIQRIMDFLQ